jgi:hypothetical protein
MVLPHRGSFPVENALGASEEVRKAADTILQENIPNVNISLLRVPAMNL